MTKWDLFQECTVGFNIQKSINIIQPNRRMASLMVHQVKICLQCRRHTFDLWVWKIPWRRKMATTPELLPGKSDGWRSLVGCSPWGCRAGHD